MPIIDNGRRIQLTPTKHASRKPPRGDHKEGWAQRLYYADTKNVRARASVYGVDAVKDFEEKLALVREHYGVNVSDALRISLHLAAKAIRANRALPEVNNDD